MASSNLRKLPKTFKKPKKSGKCEKIPMAFHKITAFFRGFSASSTQSHGASRRGQISGRRSWSTGRFPLVAKIWNRENWVSQLSISQHVLHAGAAWSVWVSVYVSAWDLSCCRKCDLRRLTSNICEKPILENRPRPHVAWEDFVSWPKTSKFHKVGQSCAKLHKVTQS